jgi:hypothetical protein
VLSHDIRSRDLKLVNANAPTLKMLKNYYFLLNIDETGFVSLKRIRLIIVRIMAFLRLYINMPLNAQQYV